MSKAAELLEKARAADAMIATAESCTGGMIASAITDIPGSSHVFDRGFVTYSNAAKIEMLGVHAQTIDLFGAVSEQVAAAMAQGALEHSNATLAVAVTGIAGPGGSETKPEGRVCFAVANKGHPVHAETVEFGARGRDSVRASTTDHAIGLMIRALDQDLLRS